MDIKNNEEELLSQCFDSLFPICRSITGPGLEQSIALFKEYMPLQIEKIPTGTQVFDWEVPPEWHFKRARLWGPNGEVVCDTNESNLHVVNYSEPVNRSIELEELQKHLHSIPSLPEAIPYVTSYYNRSWGFCLPHKQRQELQPGTYKVEIDSSFFHEGGVPFAHCTIVGESSREILLTSYLCHPSLANNELSGPLVLLGLHNRIQQWSKRRFSYRFLLNPETIGSLCFLSKYYRHLQSNLEAGLILTCVGGPESNLKYKSSRMANSLFDSYVSYLADHNPTIWKALPFNPLGGSDERQYCSPGFNLPMGQISRTTYGQYDGYHNSLDTKEFMDIKQLIKTIDQLEAFLLDAEIAGKPLNLSPYGEPQLGKRGLYPNVNSPNNWRNSSDRMHDDRKVLNAILTILNLADGEHSILEIANLLDLPLDDLRPIIEKLESENLIRFNSEQNV
ncbi:DUF4910 domain-containing protein [Neptuniibacter sp.]|uniref:DUF4910 domain-containing protein n=1 Tax=Neptuniibacter sp. TaxID=1962643 RepID=UPI0026226C8F|nr:DUF4910 domain-containing protein [Neptuniibacter sp.]MCP4595915.1 DUF4910 domain-containing protein [Neptuniibacter sp.]